MSMNYVNKLIQKMESLSERNFHLNNNIVFSVSESVYVPSIESNMLVSYFLNHKTDDKLILDYGTGSGYLSLIVAKEFISEDELKIVATDINPQAINCAKINFLNNNVNEKIDLRKGDGFTIIKENELFNTILASLPYHDGKPKKWLEYSFYDENLKMRTDLFKNANKHLAPKGRILFTYSEKANEDIPLVDLLNENNLTYSIKDMRGSLNEGAYYLYEIKRNNE